MVEEAGVKLLNVRRDEGDGPPDRHKSCSRYLHSEKRRGSAPNKYDLLHTNEPCNLFINHHGCLCWQGFFFNCLD